MVHWHNFYSLESPRHKKSSLSGMTLLEVLVALTIVSIALITVIKTTSQNIQHSTYLQQKMIASWVATEMLNEIRAHVLNLKGGEIEETRSALGIPWDLKATINETPNPKIKKIEIDVFKNEKKLQHLSGYLYDNN